MKTLKSNLKQPIIFAKIIAVSIAIFLCASCDNGNGKRLAKAKNDPAGTYREYLSDIRRQKKLSIKELAGHLKQWQTLRDSVFLHLECDTLGRLHSTVREECEQIHDSIRMEFSRMVLSQTRTYKDILWVKDRDQFQSLRFSKLHDLLYFIFIRNTPLITINYHIKLLDIDISLYNLFLIPIYQHKKNLNNNL